MGTGELRALKMIIDSFFFFSKWLSFQRRQGNECVRGRFRCRRLRRCRRHRGLHCKVAQLLLAGLPAPDAGDSSEEKQEEHVIVEGINAQKVKFTSCAKFSSIMPQEHESDTYLAWARRPSAVASARWPCPGPEGSEECNVH